MDKLHAVLDVSRPKENGRVEKCVIFICFFQVNPDFLEKKLDKAIVMHYNNELY